MKKSAILALSVLGVVSSLAHGEVINRVTLSGKATSESLPVIRETPTSSSYSSRLISQSVTNATILDDMVFYNEIPTRVGYSIVEIFDDSGELSGFYAYNSRTGDIVEVDPDLLSTLGNIAGAVAYNSIDREFNPVYKDTSIATGTSVLFGTDVFAFGTGSTQTRTKNYRLDGEVFVFTYNAISYSCVLRGAIPPEDLGDVEFASTILDVKLTSSGNVFEPSF